MPHISYIAFPVAFALVLFRKYREYLWGKYVSSKSLKGKVFLVTGANNGIGKETALQLAQRQATVILACRDLVSTDKAIENIRKKTQEGELIPHYLDLASFASIRNFASEINSKYARIDVLINNAGVAVPLASNDRTKEGFELNFGINHLGHFLLTQLLTQKLVDSAPSRIVIVSSLLHERGTINFDDLNLNELRSTGKKTRLSPGYCNSKLANAYHARELAERLKDKGVDVRVLCPGWTYTSLFRYSEVKWYQYLLTAPIAFVFMRSAWQGSQTVMYCATEPNLPGESGDFYRDCTHYVSKVNFDDEVQKKLWKKSEEFVQLK